MPRYRLTLEYDGGPYNGLQAQTGQPSVQASVEAAVKGFCGQAVRLHAAGRTDSGVHATGQVVHIDLERDWDAEVVRNALNAHLSREPIAVLDSALVGEDFHARFSATERRYLYRILNRRSPPALERGKVWHVRKPLDADAMHAAAQALVGLHDFTTFRDVACQAKSPVKTLDVATVQRLGEEVRLVFTARKEQEDDALTAAAPAVSVDRRADDPLTALKRHLAGNCLKEAGKKAESSTSQQPRK